MTPDGTDAPRFRIGYLDGALASLNANQAVAAAGGYGPDHHAAAGKVRHALRTAADTFGEALYDLPNARLQVRRAVIRPVVVVYAVHYRQPEVFVHSFKLLAPSA